ncbi:MAG: ribonuclease D [Balneolaceae bacterium]
MTIQYIADNSALEESIAHLNTCTEFSIDLEFDKNRYRYGFNLCLMQIFTGEQCFLIDPLSADLTIEKIFPVLANPNIQKIVFAFGEDLRLLHSLGCFPKNLYDLDVATSLLNYAPASLTNLLAEIIGIEVGKSSQQSNWFQRPLSEQQINYAAEDVLYLLTLKEELLKQAKKAKITDWITQENSIFDTLDYSDEDHNPIIKEKDKKDLSVFEWHIFTRLSEFIDTVAQKYSKPNYQIMDKKVLDQISRNPGKIGQWEKLPGIYRKLKNDQFKKEISGVLEEIISEAEQKNLSKTEKAETSFTKEEYLAFREEQRRINQIKEEVFIPIQQRIVEDYGKNVKSFLLSNRQIKEIITGEGSIPDYKKSLFQNYAEELNLDVSPYLNSEKKAS